MPEKVSEDRGGGEDDDSSFLGVLAGYPGV